MILLSWRNNCSGTWLLGLFCFFAQITGWVLGTFLAFSEISTLKSLNSFLVLPDWNSFLRRGHQCTDCSSVLLLTSLTSSPWILAVPGIWLHLMGSSLGVLWPQPIHPQPKCLIESYPWVSNICRFVTDFYVCWTLLWKLGTFSFSVTDVVSTVFGNKAKKPEKRVLFYSCIDIFKLDSDLWSLCPHFLCSVTIIPQLE